MDPAGIRTQDLLNTSQTLFTIKPLGLLAVEHCLHISAYCLDTSVEFQLILTLSERARLNLKAQLGHIVLLAVLVAVIQAGVKNSEAWCYLL